MNEFSSIYSASNEAIKIQYMTKRGPKISLGGNQGVKLRRGSMNQGRINNPLLLIMGWLRSTIWEYLISTKGENSLYMTWYTMTYIGGVRPFFMLYLRWCKWLLNVRYRRIFLDINPDFFWMVMDYLNDQKYHISWQYPEKVMCRK